MRMVPRYGDRQRSPVFGRVVSREPLLPQRVPPGQRQRIGSDAGSTRVYGAEPKTGGNGRRPSQYRYVGANGGAGGAQQNSAVNAAAVQGSFQKLKELIWTERAKELTQQRRAEELAARAAVLKEIASGQNIQSLYKQPFKSDSPMMDENRTPDRDLYQHVNDGRLSIAVGQSQTSNHGDSNNQGSSVNLGRAGTRSYGGARGGKSGGAHKFASIFSGSATPNSGRAARLMLPSLGYVAEDSRESGSGIPIAYPLRPSHFRERNRSLFKNPAVDYYQRDVKRGSSDGIRADLFYELANAGATDYTDDQESQTYQKNPIYPIKQQLTDELMDYGNIF